MEIIKKSEQYNDLIFDGKFHANKPVFNAKIATKPFSSLYYWSHSYVNDDCEFGLHPHEGFEIMTFLFEGSIEHYDTTTQIWTPLNAGDFQIIQSNSGIQHKERISKNSRAFQIWFDPNFEKALQLKPNYVDYSFKDFQPINKDGILTTTYIGEGSIAKALTTNLSIKKLIFNTQTSTRFQLNETMSYAFYVLNGRGSVNNQKIEIDDTFRVTNTKTIDINFQGELFYIEMPTILKYHPIWT